MKQWIVGFTYTEYGNAVVNAETAEEATRLLKRSLEDYGVSGMDNIVGREIDVYADPMEVSDDRT